MNFGRVMIHEVSKSMTTLFRSILGGAVGCRMEVSSRMTKRDVVRMLEW